VSAFITNVERFCRLGRIPSRIVYETKRATQAEGVAAFTLLGHPLVSRDLPAERLQQVQSKTQELLSRDPEDQTTPETERLIYAISPGADYNMLSDEVKPAYETLMHTMIVMAWTAFEVLAEDLWVTCLNARPRLGFIALDAEPDPGDTEAEAERKKNRKVAFPAWMLRVPEFDSQKCMGTALREMGKWDFANRMKAGEAYSKVFRDSATDLDAFFGSDDLRWVAAIRNTLVHNAGIADAEFVKLAKRHPTLGAVKENQAIPIDGMLMLETLRAACIHGVGLIRWVDEWMKRNPT
jgi:hypothetical protein